jgi:DNA-binding response OmpR family regulator
MAKILIVDDDPENREILRARLERAGHAVSEAVNGEEGLRLIDTDRPDLVLLDVMMPKIDGWHVCRQIKSNVKTETLPVVMLTAMGQQIDKLRGWESGADEYLMKPWDPVKLLEIVNKLCLAAQKQGSSAQEIP